MCVHTACYIFGARTRIRGPLAVACGHQDLAPASDVHWEHGGSLHQAARAYAVGCMMRGYCAFDCTVNISSRWFITRAITAHHCWRSDDISNEYRRAYSLELLPCKPLFGAVVRGSIA
eukprot:6254029-Pyramimonas_sp.AAC.1